MFADQTKMRTWQTCIAIAIMPIVCIALFYATPRHRPQTFWSCLQNALDNCRYDEALELLQHANVERQVKHDKCGLCWFSEDIAYYPTAKPPIQSSRHDHLIGRTANSQLNRALDAFAVKYNRIAQSTR